MKRLLFCACAVTWLLAVSASPLNEIANPLSSSCDFTPPCDATGEEKVPIPCKGYCDSYFFCKEGKYTRERCPLFSNFNNLKRKCEVGFTNCEWWNPSNSTTTTTTNKPGQTGSPGQTGGPGQTGSGGPGQTGSGGPNPTPSLPGGQTTESPESSYCEYKANCDATGTERKPIPCKNFCNRYYLCVEGKPTVETCPPLQNFDNVTRSCLFSFRNCDWYKTFRAESTTNSPTRATGQPATLAPGTGRPNTNPPVPPKVTPTPSSAMAILPNVTVLVLLIASARLFGITVFG